MGHDYDDDYYGRGRSRGDTSSVIVRIIVGAIIVAILILLFLWLLPFIGFIFVAALGVFGILLGVLGLLWLFRSAARGVRRYRRRRDSDADQGGSPSPRVAAERGCTARAASVSSSPG